MLLGVPLLLEFGGCQIAQGRVNAFVHVNVLEKRGNLLIGIGEVLIV